MNILEKIESRQFNPGDYVAHFKHINLSDNSDNPMKYLYQVETIARDCDDPNKAIVIYRQLYSEGDLKEVTIWARPYKDFVSEKSPYKYFDNVESKYGSKVKVFVGVDTDDKNVLSSYPNRYVLVEIGTHIFVYSDIFLDFTQIEMCIRRHIVKDEEFAESRIKSYHDLFKNFSTQYRFRKVSSNYVKRCSERAFALQEAKLLTEFDKTE